MAVIETWFEQDLQKPVKVRYIDGNLFSHNGNGNRIGVIVTNNGEPVTLTGTVSGYAVLADGTTVPCTGTRSGNKASILVPAAAYSPGSILISIFLTDGTTITTLAALSSSVIMTRTNNQVSPGSVVTDWTNTINAAMQSVETAAANLGNIVATPYANLTFPVPLGKYTIYNNGLYRCISPIASSEAWTATHWTNVKLGDDVAELKSAFDESFVIDSIYDSSTNTHSSYYSNGGVISGSPSWNRTKLYALDTDHKYFYSGVFNFGSSAVVNCYFNANREYIGEFLPSAGFNMLNPPEGAAYVAFSIKNEDENSFNLISVISKDILKTVDVLALNEFFLIGVLSYGNFDVNAGLITDNSSPTKYIHTGYICNTANGTNFTLADGYVARTYVYDRYLNRLSVSAFSNKVQIDNKQRIFRIEIRKEDRTDIGVNDFTTAVGSGLDTHEKAVFAVKDINEDVTTLKTIASTLSTDVEMLKKQTFPNQVATLEDSAWSWWMYPQAIVYNSNRRFAAIGEVNSSGVAGIAELNLETKQELKINVWEAGNDDHNGMCILQRPNSHLLIAGTKHGEENILHLWRSYNRNSVDTLDVEVTIDFGEYVTYCQMFNTPDNKVVLFVRVNVNKWYVCYSTDNYGQAWEEPHELIYSNRQYYCMFRPTTNARYLNVAMYSNPNLDTTDTRIRCGVYDITDRKLRSAAGTELGGVDTPVGNTTVPIVIDIPNYSQTGTLRNRLLDLAITEPGTYAILYARFNDATDGVYHASINGVDYTIANAGGCFYIPSCYYGGAVFVPKNTATIYLSRYYDNRYHLEKYILSDASYVFSEELDQSNIDGLDSPVCRPVIDIDGEILFWQKGSTNTSSFMRYSYDARYKLLQE